MTNCTVLKNKPLEKKDSKEKYPIFKISLAEWSLHRYLFTNATKSNLDFPVMARKYFEIDAVEYVNQFFPDKAEDTKYLRELKTRSYNEGVRNILIMCDNEGKLASKSRKERESAVKNHYKWIDAAKFLGCHSLRITALGEGTPEEQKNHMVESLVKLSEYSGKLGINVIVENHGGLSSNAVWLSDVIKKANNPFIGTLPDFGNFSEKVNIYESVGKMMPFAKGVSAKAYDFDEKGNETRIDYEKMIRVVVLSGYQGYVGIEYEGENLNEFEGIRKTKSLLEKVRAKISD